MNDSRGTFLYTAAATAMSPMSTYCSKLNRHGSIKRWVHKIVLINTNVIGVKKINWHFHSKTNSIIIVFNVLQKWVVRMRHVYLKFNLPRRTMFGKTRQVLVTENQQISIDTFIIFAFTVRPLKIRIQRRFHSIVLLATFLISLVNYTTTFWKRNDIHLHIIRASLMSWEWTLFPFDIENCRHIIQQQCIQIGILS